MQYPSSDLYRILYARYFARSPEELLKRAERFMSGGIKDKSVMDLCGGGGRVSKAALKMGARDCLLVDESAHMTSAAADRRIRVINVDVHKFFTGPPEITADVSDVACHLAVCQQSVNYWFWDLDVAALWDYLLPDGVFVFNTFQFEPPITPRTKKYKYKNRRYIEISWLCPKIVYGITNFPVVQHVQICEGYPPHTTSFAWISPEQFSSILEPWFDVNRSVDDHTALYYCVRKNLSPEQVQILHDKAHRSRSKVLEEFHEF